MNSRAGKTTFLCLFVLALSLLFARALHAQGEPFYKGKTIRIVTGFGAGDVDDQWPRLIGPIMTKYIPGNPSVIVQNMAGAGSMVAANYVYGVAKPDGLTLGWISPGLYIDQLLGKKEVQFDWTKFSWIGSPVQSNSQMYMRADAPYRTIEEIRKAAEPPRCGSSGQANMGYYLPRLLEETLDLKFKIVTGYQGGNEVDLGVQRGEIHCRGMSIEAFFAREPFHTWRKTGFVRNLVQTGRKRDPQLPEVPTLYELMDKHNTAEGSRRLASVVLTVGVLGRPMVAAPTVPADRIRVLRGAFASALKDAELIAEAKRRNFGLQPVGGEELEVSANEVMAQPLEVIQRLGKLLGR
ncbi:MAG: tripartite tricarboxylate transporter substrate-binding protein [Deltaproteobacteria bacterium]|nr:tripartite tricarboxylate transporter substrate-binding protein [Deltaproteobacteria bacterium]